MALSGFASSQAPGEGRGSVAPGTAADGSRPADGAGTGDGRHEGHWPA